STANIVNILDFLSFRIDSLVTLCFIVSNEGGIQMLIKEVATLAGVSVRTLHYYDELELLTPDMTTDAGYRVYSERNLTDLQQILYLRGLDFPLKKIKHMLQHEEFEQLEALELQHEKLKTIKHLLEQKEIERLEALELKQKKLKPFVQSFQ